MECYEKYKDSGIAWLGKIPEYWQTRKLRYLFQIKKRIAGELGFDIFSITQKGIKIKNIESKDGQISSDYSKYQIVEQGDFAMNNMDLLTGFVDIANQKGVTSPDYRVFTLTDENSQSKFYLYLFQLGYFRKIFYAFGRGAALFGRWRFPADEFNEFRFPVPPLEEQRLIAAFLDHKTAEIDELIAQKQRLIALYEEERTAIINEAVTKGINPDVKLKPTAINWLGDIPEHWHKKKLKILASQIGDGIHTTPQYQDFQDIYFINGTNLIDGKITVTSGTRSVDEDEYKKYQVNLKYKSILISLNGTIGKMAFYRGERVILGKSAAYIELLSAINSDFLYFFLKSHYIFNYFEDSLSGTTIRNLSLHTLRNTQIFFPPLEEQKVIAEYIEKETARIDAKIAKTKRIIELQKEYRTALISEAVTGKIKVPDLVS